MLASPSPTKGNHHLTIALTMLEKNLSSGFPCLLLGFGFHANGLAEFYPREHTRAHTQLENR